MSKHHHRDRSWAPAPEALPDDAQTIDNHTHVASVIPFARAMSHEAQEKGQPEVPVYDVDQLLAQAQSVGIGGIIDCGCELPHLMTAVQMALDHPGNVHAALAIHPNESVLHGHRGVPGPDGLPLKYKPYHDTSFEDALAEVHRLATTYPEQVVAIGETGMDLFRTGEGAKELQREAFRAHIALAKELGPSGITVNCVAPGVIDTEMNRQLSQETKAALAEETPLERLGTPEDVAQAIWFLASPAGDFFTGQVLSPNGGYLI